MVSLSEDNALDVALQVDEKIVVAVKGNTDFTTIRLNTDGTLDANFDSDGIARIDFGGAGFETAYGVAIQPDGKIVVVGSSEVDPTQFGFDMAITRLNSDGSIDNTFGTNGIVTYGSSSNSIDEAADVAIGVAGQIIVVGYAPGFTVLQYNVDGTLDNNFGNQGVVSGIGNRGYSLALQPDHKIVAAGYANSADFAVVRLEGMGLPNKVYLPLVVSQ